MVAIGAPTSRISQVVGHSRGSVDSLIKHEGWHRPDIAHRLPDPGEVAKTIIPPGWLVTEEQLTTAYAGRRYNCSAAGNARARIAFKAHRKGPA
jgi:hypothetical protein